MAFQYNSNQHICICCIIVYIVTCLDIYTYMHIYILPIAYCLFLIPLGCVSLPPDFPRVAMANPPPPDWRLEYPTTRYARDHGLSWYYFSAGWACYERHFAIWAELEGYKVAYLTQMDLHQGQLHGVPVLTPFKCAVFVGHDEYWTWEMRDAVDAYLDSGGHVARFAGNFFWQVRLAGDKIWQVCLAWGWIYIA